MRGGGRTIAIGHRPSAIRRAVPAAALVACALWLAACGTAPWGSDNGRAGLSCIDDSPHCVGQRQATLEAMVADRQRTWVKQAPTPAAHASGVRLFAFRRTKAKLTCAELSHGRREAAAAPSALRGQPGLTPAQVSRASLFAAEVQRELAAEMHRRRCAV